LWIQLAGRVDLLKVLIGLWFEVVKKCLLRLLELQFPAVRRMLARYLNLHLHFLDLVSKDLLQLIYYLPQPKRLSLVIDRAALLKIGL
jgi:DNA polymerase III sliding clamp (beta) subunit (PCNA family)